MMGRCTDCGASLEFDDGAPFCLVCDERKGHISKATDAPWTPAPTLVVLEEIATWVMTGAEPKPHGAGCWREHPECMLSIALRAVAEGDYAGVSATTAGEDES